MLQYGASASDRPEVQGPARVRDWCGVVPHLLPCAGRRIWYNSTHAEREDRGKMRCTRVAALAVLADMLVGTNLLILKSNQ